jgi:hypothetical protein
VFKAASGCLACVGTPQVVVVASSVTRTQETGCHHRGEAENASWRVPAERPVQARPVTATVHLVAHSLISLPSGTSLSLTHRIMGNLLSTGTNSRACVVVPAGSSWGCRLPQ